MTLTNATQTTEKKKNKPNSDQIVIKIRAEISEISETETKKTI